jgi:hypothetical protein
MNQLPSYHLHPTASDGAIVDLKMTFLVPLLDRDFEMSLCCSCGKINGTGSGCGECQCGSESGSGSGS